MSHCKITAIYTSDVQCIIGRYTAFYASDIEAINVFLSLRETPQSETTGRYLCNR